MHTTQLKPVLPKSILPKPKSQFWNNTRMNAWIPISWLVCMGIGGWFGYDFYRRMHAEPNRIIETLPAPTPPPQMKDHHTGD